jgi:hypothetical protein
MQMSRFLSADARRYIFDREICFVVIHMQMLYAQEVVCCEMNCYRFKWPGLGRSQRDVSNNLWILNLLAAYGDCP